MTTERDSVKKKIIALLSKTQDNGASEFEAMAAAEKAAELMALYDIEATELEIKNQNCVKTSFVPKKYGRTTIGDFFATPIAALCDCKMWVDKTGEESKFIYFGFSQDVEVAAYMYDLISTAILSELNAYKQSEDYEDARARNVHPITLNSSFLYGMETRIGKRIKAMAAEKKSKVQAATGTALVIVKEDRINEEFSDLGLKLRSNTSNRSAGDFTAMARGRLAGEKVNLGTGIAGTKSAGVLA